jgi:hypothetical protein
LSEGAELLGLLYLRISQITVSHNGMRFLLLGLLQKKDTKLKYNKKIVLAVVLPLATIISHAAYIFVSEVEPHVYRDHALAISFVGGAIAIYGTVAAVFVACSEGNRPVLNQLGAAARNIGGSFALYGLWLGAFANVS